MHYCRSGSDRLMQLPVQRDTMQREPNSIIREPNIGPRLYEYGFTARITERGRACERESCGAVHGHAVPTHALRLVVAARAGLGQATQ